jgi:hypothetical protein
MTVLEKLNNIELVVEDIKKFPQTYNTILGNLFKDGTSQFILRRKLGNLIKDGTVCKTTIPGTRFGMVIFYCLPKPYYILVEGGRKPIDVFCFFEFSKQGMYYINVEEYWTLNGNKWKKYNSLRTFFQGNVLMFI